MSLITQKVGMRITAGEKLSICLASVGGWAARLEGLGGPTRVIRFGDPDIQVYPDNT